MTVPRNDMMSRALRSTLLCLSAACLVIAAGTAAAQSVPTGFQEYYVLGHEQHMWDMMDKVQNGQGGAQFANGMNSVVTATASANNQVVYYDHWEDGFEADIFSPVQISTLIIGDGDPSNGDACDFNSDPCGTDILLRGDFVNFGSDQGLGAGCTIPSAQPATFTELCSSVTVNPRCVTLGACTAAEVQFDGGDFITTSGGPLAIIHSQYPLTQFIGGSTEMLSRQAVEAALSYSVPVGEDLYPAFGCPNCVMEPFHYVDLNLVAFDDGTQIVVDSPGAGTLSFTLNRGEHWSSLGYVDNGAYDPTLFLTINAGTKVSTTRPIAGLLFTGGDGTWATRHYALLPDLLHSTDYVITAPGDNPAVGPSIASRPLNIYLFNPDPLSAINITTTDTVGTNIVNVPANSVVDYFSGTGRFVPSGSTVRMTSDRNFWGVSGYDYNTNISDWGHSWLASKFLTRNYTVSFAPGNLDPTVNAINLNGVFIAATQNNTQVRLDLDNDGDFDAVDTNGDGLVNPGAGDPMCDVATPNCVYTVNSLSSLRVFDPNDFDNTGTRIVANKPVAVAWGQDTDLTGYGDVALDTGFTVYPTNQLFLDPVLVVDKAVDTPVVPTAGGVVTYTITVSAFEFGLLTNLQVYDLLPIGVPETAYVPGSTLVTYPNLTQDTTDPTLSPGRLDWTLSPDSIDTNQKLTIRYQINIPAAPGGTPRVLTNEAHAQANFGASVFSPLDTAEITQTDITISKSVDLATTDPGNVLTYTIQLFNNGVNPETGATITDVIPADTVFCDATTLPLGTCNNPTGPGPGAYDSGQNAVVWPIGNFPVGGPVNLTFQVMVNPGASAGTLITNSANYESNQTPLVTSNEVETVINGPRLELLKTGPSVLHPNEIASFDIVVRNTGVGDANNLLIIDPIPANVTYLAESMAWQLNVGAVTPVTDAADADEGVAFVDRLELSIPVLGPGQDVTFRFFYTVDPGTEGLVVNNQATVTSTETTPRDTNLVQVPIVGDAVLTGHVFSDTDGNGTQDPGEPDLANIDVVVVDSAGNPQTISTDSSGNWSVTVEAGAATADVDENDPDLPDGAILSTANDPQPAVAISGNTVATAAVGYTPLPFSFFKSSSAGGEVFPGDTITYTIEATNFTGIDQTAVLLDDPLPTGTSAGSGSTQVTVNNPVFRVSEYFIPVGSFGGTVYDLTLDQDLIANYFAIVQGSSGSGGTNGDRDPEADYARLTQDPFGTGDLGVSAAADVLRIERRDGANSWVGVITVVECVAQCGIAGFELLAVEEVVHGGATESGSDIAATGWTDINQVLLMGGFNGAGCYSDETTDRDHPVCHARLFPSGSDQINWTRDGSNAAVNLTAATSTVMVVEWGSEWTVQRVNVTGTNGGNGLNAAAEYNTAAISSVARANTWVWGTGHANGDGIGNQAEGAIVALGNGVAQNPNESLVAVGTEISGTGIDFEVWALTHPSLVAEHLFKVDGDAANLTVDVAAAVGGSQRMALVTNGQAGTSDNYPRPIFSARYFNPSLIRLERRRSNSNFPAWVQGIDFSDISSSTIFTGGDPTALVDAGDGVTLVPTGSITVTFDVVVDPDLSPAITEIQNTATITTDQEGPLDASVTDDVIRLGLVVEYNNAGFVEFDPLASSTVTYAHEVINTGLVNDSYQVTAFSESGFANPAAGWVVELIDPDTGVTIATDTDFTDATWDGGLTVNTGSLAPGSLIEYEIRVTVPAGAPVGAQESTTLTAVSDRTATVSEIATDETFVVGQGDLDGMAVLLPDNSGVASAGGTEIYSHTIINNTGATDTFDLEGWSESGWDFAFYWDANGDGVYTPGVDVEITNTLQLADGASQRFFVVVDVPLAAPDAEDVLHIGAVSRNNVCDPVTEECSVYIFASATDTTTISPPTELDLSGGGTQPADPGDVAIYPGTLKSHQDSGDRFDFSISPAWFFGFDGLNHPTLLVIDTDSDGVPDTQIAEDSNGDGIWDTIAPGFDTDADNRPDVFVAAGAEIAYELQRPVDPLQGHSRDPVTLTAVSQGTSDQDSITATVLVAAATAAVLADFEVYGANGQVFVEWRTSAEIGTIGFELWRWRDGEVAYRRVTDALIPGLRHYLQGGTYRLVDSEVATGDRAVYLLRERDRWGTGRDFGPFDITIAERGAKSRGAPSTPLGVSRSPNRSSVRIALLKGAVRSGQPSGLAKVLIRETGMVQLSAETLAEALDTDPATISDWIANREIWIGSGAGAVTGPPGPTIFDDGFESGDDTRWGAAPPPSESSVGIAWLPAGDNDGLSFYAEGIDSIYTLDNVYWLGRGAGRIMPTRSAAAGETGSESSFNEVLHVEVDQWPLTSVMTDPEADFWMWDYFFPYDGEPVVSKTFDLATPGAADTVASALLSVNLQGSFDAGVPENHLIEIRVNGLQLGGTLSWSGLEAKRFDLRLPQGILNDGVNEVEITALLKDGLFFDEFYIDSFDISYQRLFEAEGDRLAARSVASSIITVSGFSTPEISVFDLTDPVRPILLTDTTIDSVDGFYRVSFASDGAGRPFLATTDGAILEPFAVQTDFASDLRSSSRRGEYVVIAPTGFETEAALMASHRAQQGLPAVVAPIEDVYDEFNGGVVNPWAIRDFLSHASQNWSLAPRFVFLVGDGTLDYHDIWGAGESLVPAPMTVTKDGLVPSDNLLADWVGADGVPEIAIGRLPAHSPAELRAYREKVIDFENATGEWKTRTLWVADAPDEGGEFPLDLQKLVDGAPQGYDRERILTDRLGGTEARQRTLQQWNDGAVLVHFLGHGALDFLSNDDLLTIEDAAGMNNSERSPFLAALTCMVGRFDIPGYDILSEALLINGEGGSVGVWAPVAFSMNEDAKRLGRHHLEVISTGQHHTIGSSIRAALESYAAEGVGDPSLVRIFSLLGDPAVRMGW